MARLAVWCVIVATLGPLAAAPWDRPGWELTWHDEFDRPELDAQRWMPRYRGNEKLPAYYLLRDGLLSLLVDKDRPPERGAGQGRVSSVQTSRSPEPFAQQYGWFELRARCAKGSGTCSAFWMSPLDGAYKNLASDGGLRSSENEAMEIDIFEHLGKLPKHNHFTVHYGRSYLTGHRSEHRQVEFADDLTADFHVYALEWTREALVWWVDGREVARSDKAPRAPFFCYLSLYEGDHPWRGNVSPQDPYPKEFAVDYLRVYRRPGG